MCSNSDSVENDAVGKFMKENEKAKRVMKWIAMT